ncbi:class I SAM-dependent methyltransferase [Nakamurella deserti]|uniref:class I SAM-dependent methyltransferase n=1 Tax=Nakamurella deserti TaxID=2164074 RepID=UPI0013006D6B|nr:class I SAM-dependent methyltransferase [Nakamurella deserti]
MTLPDALDRRLTDELAALPRSAPLVAVPDLPEAPEPEPAAPAAPAPPRRRALPRPAAVKRRARETALRQLDRAIHRIGRTAAARDVVEGLLAERTGEVRAAVDRLEERLAVLSGQLATVTADQGQSVADRINFSLMQNDVTAISGRVDEVLAEMREQERRLLELGMAFAPGAGLGGAAVRFAELREQINSVERRLRHAPAAAAIEGPGAVEVPTAAGTPASVPTGGPGVASELFNYVAFERRFRGDPETIIGMQADRYHALLAAHPPVVDVGCGRAELLEALQGDGIECIGVDTDSGMVAEARARGLDVRHTDVVAFLEAADDHSLGSVFSAHLAEHLELDVLIRFLELSARKLKPGGVFIAETPNPASLIVLGNSYILDPTHVRPLHPSLLAFLCETAGFRQVRLEFYSPATSYQLETIRDADGPAWLRTVNENSERLNEVLFGPQEYAVIATTPE